MIATFLTLAVLSSDIPKEPLPPTYYAEQHLDQKEYYGDFELTAYNPTGNPCADGIMPREGVTAASNDPALWHKCIYIEDVGIFYIHDTGAMSKNVIDIYMEDRSEALQFGRRTGAVYIID